MKKKDDNKRLFLGMEVKAPWPSKCAGGRIICETSRHITLVFFWKHFIFSSLFYHT